MIARLAAAAGLDAVGVCLIYVGAWISYRIAPAVRGRRARRVRGRRP